MNDVVTPINADKLEYLLESTGYDEAKSQYLVDGFKNGFDLGYRGPENIKQRAPNLKFTVGNKTVLWNKVMKEVKEGRYAGPFSKPPFDNYIQSPIGLVPKDNGKKTRLIFHLSYPRESKNGHSVNGSTPCDMTSVKYPDFDQAIRLCIKAGKGCMAGKSDLSSAFRHLAIRKSQWKYLIMKAENPLDGKIYFFMDKCLPFGASISCHHFQEFSDALSHIVKHRNWQQDNVNYLDDFFFVAAMKYWCDQQLRNFLTVCQEINFPVSLEKTEWSCTKITFLGLLIDTVNQLICLPLHKVEVARNKIRTILQRKSKKSTLHEIQQLAGYLNFLCKAIIPGRAFTRRLYAQTQGILKPYHHLPIKQEIRLDLEM